MTKSFKSMRHNEDVLKKETGKAQKLFSFPSGPLSLVNAFVAENSYRVCPFPHRFGDFAPLDKFIDSIKEPHLLAEKVFNCKVKSGSAPRYNKVVALFRMPESLLSFKKGGVDLFGNSFVGVKFGRRGKNTDNIKIVADVRSCLFSGCVEVPSIPQTDDRISALRALTEDRNRFLSWGGQRGRENAPLYGHDLYTDKGDILEAVRAYPAEDEHLGGILTWS